jgi:hypothetical protein
MPTSQIIACMYLDEEKMEGLKNNLAGAFDGAQRNDLGRYRRALNHLEDYGPEVTDTLKRVLEKVKKIAFTDSEY